MILIIMDLFFIYYYVLEDYNMYTQTLFERSRNSESICAFLHCISPFDFGTF